MDQVYVVRHKVLVEGQPIRRVAREMGIARNTVRKYLEQPAPVRVEKEPRARPVREQVAPRIEALLAESPRWTGGKQRLTAARLHKMLVVEGFSVGITTVKEAVAEWKRQRRTGATRNSFTRSSRPSRPRAATPPCAIDFARRASRR